MDLPLKLTWLSSSFLVIGGGGTVTMAACLMVVTDVSPEHNRSKIFFICQAASLVAEITGPAIGSITMEKFGVWPPVLVGLLCTCITAVLAGTIPETRRAKTNESLDDVLPDPQGSRQSVCDMLGYIKRTIQVMFQNRSILVLVASFLIVDFSRQSLTILLQYVSKRYDIPIAKVSRII
jgi:MFS family permease